MPTDKKVLRYKSGKTNIAMPHNLQIQSLFGKVCSTVKSLLNPTSWFSVPNWIDESDHQHRNLSDNLEDKTANGDIISQSVSNTNKRLRLRLDEHNFQDSPTINHTETQTWPEQPGQNLYEPIHIAPTLSSTAQSSLLGNNDVTAITNGGNLSENSEGSISTSKSSSVSSHKESNRLSEHSFVNLLDAKSFRKRKETSPNSDYNNLNNSRGLWSTDFCHSLQNQCLEVSSSNQPNFSLSSFASLSRLNKSFEKKISSPFYKGKTAFGGASSVRRTPASFVPYESNESFEKKIPSPFYKDKTAFGEASSVRRTSASFDPYKVDRSVRNQNKNQELNSKDKCERMSSAAEIILLTLDKIDSPVSNKKRTAATSGFSFGTPTASDTNATFPSSFSMNTDSSINFGAASAPVGSFQFVASDFNVNPASAINSGPRKFCKTVRRVNRG